MPSILKSVWRRALPPRYRDRLSGLWQRVRAGAAQGQRRFRFRRIRIRFGPSAPRKVFLIVVDCLRRDALSFYGNPRSTTPFLDNLAQSDGRALALGNFYGSSSWTYPAVVSILSGLYPHNHGGCFHTAMREMNKGQIPDRRRDDVLMLPDAFHKNGYVSYFISPSYHASRGAEQAFRRHHYSKALTEKDLFELLGDTALERPQQKQFFYAHTMALHTPASLPPEYQRAFDDHTVQPEDLAADWKFKDGNVNRDDPAFRQYRHERLLYYDRALRLTDDCLMRLFDRLAQTGLLEQSMFVITSDHGEEFWEHVEAEKEFFTDPSTWGIRHGHNLYQEVIHLPCIVWHNCLEAKLKARLQNQLLSHVDLFNLVLHLNGVAGRLPGNDGIGFGDAVSERSCILAEDVAYGFEKKAVVRPPYKLLVCRGDGVSWLFNLEDDPEEQSPLDGPTSVVEELAEALPPAQEEAGRPIRADEDTLNKLRDLGYLE